MPAFASNFQLQNIRVGGTGCPSDITQIAMAQDLSSASLIFQSFESHVPTAPNPKGGTNISILNCNIFLDVKLPSGQKLDSIEISYDMRGHTFLSQGVTGNFRSFLISKSGLGTERNDRVQRPELLQERSWLNTSIDQEEDFIIQTTKIIPISSQCGRGTSTDIVSLHLQHQLGSQILGEVDQNRSEGTITMDSSDVTGGIRFRAITSECQKLPQEQGDRGPRPMPGPGRNCRFIRIGYTPKLICE